MSEMAIEVHREYLGGLFKGKPHEVQPGDERVMLHIVRTFLGATHTVLVLEVLDPNVVDISSYRVGRNEPPILLQRKILMDDMINEQALVDRKPSADRGILNFTSLLARDVYRWNPDPISSEKSEEA